MDRKWLRIGGWAALTAGALSVALVGLVALAQGAAHWTPPTETADFRIIRIQYPLLIALALTITRASFAIALAFVVLGVRASFSPPTRVVWLSAVCGLTASFMLLTPSLLGPLFDPFLTPPWLNMVGYWAPLPLGMWLLITAAIAWKLDRLPRWVRVLAAIIGAIAFMQPAIPELGLLVFMLGFIWWPGLGVTLLREELPCPRVTIR